MLEFFLIQTSQMQTETFFCMLGAHSWQTGILCSVLEKSDCSLEHNYHWFVRRATCAAAERIGYRVGHFVFDYTGGRVLRHELCLLASGHTVLTTGPACYSEIQSTSSSVERNRLFHLPYFRHLKLRWITSGKCLCLSMECTECLRQGLCAEVHKKKILPPPLLFPTVENYCECSI